MTGVAGWVLGGVLLVLAALHFYWAAGGGWGIDATIPRRGGADGGRLFRPGRIGAGVVGALLLVAAASAAMEFGLKPPVLRVMAVGFAARAVGEFRYVGFFKRVRDTKFADYDTRLFSPLCLAMSGLAWVAAG